MATGDKRIGCNAAGCPLNKTEAPYCWLDHDTMTVHFSLYRANMAEDMGHTIIALYRRGPGWKT